MTKHEDAKAVAAVGSPLEPTVMQQPLGACTYADLCDAYGECTNGCALRKEATSEQANKTPAAR